MTVERKFDKQGRITISPELLELSNIPPKSRIAICFHSPDCVLIRCIDNVNSCKILTTVSLDEKNRFIMPTKLRCSNGFYLYVMDGDLYVEEVHQ